MRFTHLAILVPLAGAVAFVGRSAGGEDEAPDAGRLFTANCAHCHTIPDPGLRTDRAFIDQVHRTAWTSTPAGARAALVRWLSATERTRPARLGADSVGKKGAAFVVSDLESGSLVLRGSGGDFTLLWEAEGSEPRRGLDPGDYRLRGARIERMKENEHWFLSSTHAEGKAHRLVRGKSTRIDIDAGVRVAASLKRKGATLHLGLNISGRDGRNLTIYRADKRVPAGYRILNGAGEIVAEGAMNYGWGGNAWAQVGLTRDHAGLRVEYILDTGPFPLEGDLSAKLGR